MPFPFPTGYLPLPAQPATLNANASEQTIAKNLFISDPTQVSSGHTVTSSTGHELVQKSHSLKQMQSAALWRWSRSI